MKMSKENFAALSAGIVNSGALDYEGAYRDAGRTHKRFRWDCYWHASKKYESLRALVHGLNDSHIDTALRKIVGTEYAPEVS